jgi:hypothetical protein
VEDVCGICGGYGDTKDCDDVCSGDAEVDACGVCGGDSSTCTGCPYAGACNYNADPIFEDYLSCTFPISDKYDCFGACAVEVDCGGLCGGTREVDSCGVCAGFGASCTEDGEYCSAGSYDCLGECDGTRVLDSCNICGGDGTLCAEDEIAYCDSNTVDCYGTCDGTLVYDICGVCGGYGVLCTENYCDDGLIDCKGECDGSLVLDACDVCGGDSTDCAGCSQSDACNYDADRNIDNDELCLYPEDLTSVKNDCFGNCLYNIDCEGTCGGNKQIDDCGTCDGQNAALDCASVCDGDAEFDACGVCGGDSSSCGEVPFTFEVNTLGTAAIIGTYSVTTILQDGLLCDQRTQLFVVHQASTWGVEAGIGGGVLGSDSATGLKTAAQEREVVNMALKTPELSIENDYIEVVTWLASPGYDYPVAAHVGVIIVNENEESIIFDCGEVADSEGVTCGGHLGDDAESWFNAEADKVVTIRAFIYDDSSVIDADYVLSDLVKSQDFGIVLQQTPVDYDSKFLASSDGMVYAALPSYSIVKDAMFTVDLLAVTADSLGDSYNLDLFSLSVTLSENVEYVGVDSEFYSIVVTEENSVLTLSAQSLSIWSDSPELLSSFISALKLATISLKVSKNVDVTETAEIQILDSVIVNSLVDYQSRTITDGMDGYVFDLSGLGNAAEGGMLIIEPRSLSDWQAFVNVTGGVDTEYVNYAALGTVDGGLFADILIRALVTCHAMGTSACQDSGAYFEPTTGFTCTVSDTTVANIEMIDDGCRLFFNGTESAGGDIEVEVQSEDGRTRTVGFRVWLPFDVTIESSDYVLSQISDINGKSLPEPFYQWATVKATAMLQGPDDMYTPRLDVTQFVSLYVEDSDSVKVDGLNIYGLSPGSALVYCADPCAAEPLDIIVNDQLLTAKLATYPMNELRLELPTELVDEENFTDFNYFTDYNISVQAKQVLTAEHQLATVYSWAVFADGAESKVVNGIQVEVLREGTVYIADDSTPPTLGVAEQQTVEQMSGSDFVMVSWYVQDILIAEHTPYLGLLFPNVIGVDLSISETVIYSLSDALVTLGAPYEANLTTIIYYEDGSERDFSTDLRTIYTSVDEVFSITGNVVTLDSATVSDDKITATFEFYTDFGAEVALLSDAMDELVVAPIAYPCYEEEESQCDIRYTLYQVGGIFQQIDITIAAHSARDAEYTSIDMMLDAQVSIDCTYLVTTGGDCSDGTCDSSECIIADNPLTNYFIQGVEAGTTTVTVYWDTFAGTFDISLDTTETEVENIEIVALCNSKDDECITNDGTNKLIVSGIVGDTFYTKSLITFTDGTSWYDTEHKEYNPLSSYLEMTSNDESIITCDTTQPNAEIKIHDNSVGLDHVRITVSAGGVVSDHIDVIANLMPDVDDVDIGAIDDFAWIDIANAAVGDEITIPVRYNANTTAITAFHIVITFDATVLEAKSAANGDGWDGSIDFTVGDPLNQIIIVSAEPSMTISGSEIELAVLNFEVLSTGSFDVSVEIIETLTTDDVIRGPCDRQAIAAKCWATVLDTSRRELFSDQMISHKLLSHALARRNLGQEDSSCQATCTDLPVGDVNGDCRFTVADLSWMKRYNGGELMSYSSEDQQLMRMDADLNGVIDSVDTTFLTRVLTNKYRFLADFPNVTIGTCDLTITASYLNAKNEPTDGFSENMYIEIASELNVDNAIIEIGNGDFGIVETDAGFATLMDVDSATGVYTAQLNFPDSGNDLAEYLEFAIMMETQAESSGIDQQRLYPFYGSSWTPFKDVGFSFVSMPIYAPQYAGGSTVNSFDFGCTCDGACFAKPGYYKAGCYNDAIDDDCVQCNNNPIIDEGPAYYFTDTGYLENICPHTECAPAPDGFYYTDHIFYDSDCESLECSSCPVGEWNQGCDQSVNQGTCVQCTAPPEGYYWVSGGATNYLDDCPVAACNVDCSIGYYNSGCNGTTSAGECVPCSNPPDGHRWTSDGDYTDSCLSEECHTECPIGQYNFGCDQTTNAGECVSCTNPPEGYYWTTDGDLLDSCEVAECNTDCARGMYNANCDQTPTNGTCVDCSTPPPGYFTTGDGDLLDECPTEACFIDCPIGEYNLGCSETTNEGSCVQCSLPPIGEYWTGDGDYIDSCPTTPCAVCETIGQWNAGCDQTTYEGECQSCTLYEGEYWTSVGDYSGPDSCEHELCNIDCPFGQWNKGCNGTNYEGDCVPCTAPPTGYYYTDDGDYTDSCSWEACPIECPIGQWRDGCDQMTVSGECVSCTTPPEGYYWTTDGDFTDSCEVEACSTECPIGEYNFGCNGTDYAGECIQCTLPPPGYFWVGDGEYSDECEVEPCSTDCPVGYYNTGCDGTTSSGTCTLCSLPPENHYFVTDGDLTDNCQVESCLSSCPIGQFADGCGGTSAGECTDCSAPPGGYYFTEDGGYSDACSVAECFTDCDYGFYNVGCDGTTSNGTCVACSALPDGYFFTGDGDLEDACGMEMCDIACPLGQFRNGCDGETVPGICEPCTATEGSYYFASNGGLEDACVEYICDDSICEGTMYLVGCGGTNAGECIDCSDPPPGYYFTNENGGYADACPVLDCPKDCPVGFYTAGCEGTNAGECVACSAAPATTYYTGNGGLRDACEVEPCNTCPTGEYNVGCENGFDAGSCMSCFNAEPGHYYLPFDFTEDPTGLYQNGGQANACPFEPCATDCDPGYYNFGCDRTTSPGICVQCTGNMLPCLDNGAGDTFAYVDVYSSPQEIALAACESHYGKGECVDGICGGFKFYHTRHPDDACTCSSEVGQFEFVYENHFDDENVNADCGNTACDSADTSCYVKGVELFVRQKTTATCDGNSWTVSLLNFGDVTDEAALNPDYSCSDFYWTSDGDLEDACSLELCEIACPIGQYNQGCGGTDAGVCVDCDYPEDGYHWSGDGNLQNACGVTKCIDSCPGGTTMSDCGGDTMGECVACADTSLGFKFNESDVGCEEIPCMSNTSVGYYMAGTCQNFLDHEPTECITSVDCSDGYAVLNPCDGTTYEDAVCESLYAVTYTCDAQECGVNRATDVQMAPYSFSVNIAGENIAVTGERSFVGGGYLHAINSTSTDSAIFGGSSNTARGVYGSVMGGLQGYVGGYSAGVTGGLKNMAGGEGSIAMGGVRNDVCNFGTDENGHVEEDDCGNNAVTMSGFNNDVPGSYSSIGGGYGNTAVNDHITAMSGRRIRTTANYATGAGGYKNKCVGRFCSVIGGSRNTAAGKYSMALGWYTRSASNRAGVLSFAGEGNNRVCRSVGQNTINICTSAGFFVNDLNLQTLVDAQDRRRKLQQQLTNEEMDELKSRANELDTQLEARRELLMQLKSRLRNLRNKGDLPS